MDNPECLLVQKIEKLGLENRARKLQENGVSLRDMSDILSSESGQKITKSTLSNFFKYDVQVKAELIQKKESLQLKVTEAEISTIRDRQDIVKGLLSIAESAEFERDRIAAYKVATEALDSLDKRIGKLTNNAGITNNINVLKLSDIPTEQLLRMVNVGRS